MTNFVEEQDLEIEALQSIFINEFEMKSTKGPKSFAIKLLPHPEGDQDNHVALHLCVTYTPKYPSEPPSFAFEEGKTLVNCGHSVFFLIKWKEDGIFAVGLLHFACVSMCFDGAA